MAFDKPTRNRLASFVGQARDLIAEEFTQQFQSLYGISEKGSITPVDQLGHLDDMGLAIAALLRERIDYLVKTNPNDRDGLKAAVARLAREQAFTVLNRLAAIRMAEKRGIIVESVGNGYQSKGFKVFEQVAGAGLGDTYRRYCRYLYCLFDELAVDLGILFDRRSPQGLLFPRETALQALLALLNAPDLDPLWAEDETIGWIYQYYNDPAERKKMRDESAAPRNSRELAVRNQFFTPRYVVEFLTDNTLGRIWYEMTQGETRLKESCRYLVRRPDEVFFHDKCSSSDAVAKRWLTGEEGDVPNAVDLACSVDGYSRHSPIEAASDWLYENIARVSAGNAETFKTQELLDLLFLLHRADHFCEGTLDRYVAEIKSIIDVLGRRRARASAEGRSQEELLNQPVFIPCREIKDPRELRLLDPACGSMHFGLYAFDLFEMIYREALDPRFGLRDALLRVVGWERNPKSRIPPSSVKLKIGSPAFSEYSSEQIPWDRAFVVVAEAPDGGDGVEAGRPYIISGDIQFRVPYRYRVPLTEFDYAKAIEENWFSAKDGDSFVEKSRCFEFSDQLTEREAEEEFLRQIPRLIIEHNIHGIDIDPRAVQIAGLSLWLRAQKSWEAFQVPPAQRPRIMRANIVCAEAMPGNLEFLKEFAATLQPPLLGQLVEKVFAQMQLAGEAGSLLRIEEEIASLVKEAKKHWQASPRAKQVELSLGLEAKRKPGEFPLDVSGISDERFWETAEERIYAALRVYAEQADNSGSFQRRLFAEDAAHGFAFIDICRKRYDVALMNPPFGLGSKPSEKYLNAGYLGSGASEVCASFYSRVLELLNNKSYFGAISSRTFYYLYSLKEWRCQEGFAKSTLCYWVDLGQGILDDAMNETAAYVVSKGRLKRHLSSFGMYHRDHDKEAAMSAFVGNGQGNFIRPLTDFEKLPDKPLCYWVSNAFVRNLSSLRAFGDAIADVQMGLAPRDEFRFSRLWWEVASSQVGRDRKWIPYAKGGELSPYYSDVELLLDAKNDLDEIKAALNQKYPYLKGNLSWVLHPENRYFEPGLTFGQRTTFLRVSVLPTGSYFSVAGKGIFGRTLSNKVLLQLINTPSCQYLVSLRRERLELDPQYQEGDVARMPWPDVPSESAQSLEQAGLESAEKVRCIASSDEVDHSFVYLKSEKEVADARAQAQMTIERNEKEADLSFSNLLGLDEQDRWFIDREILPRWHSRSTTNWYAPADIDCLQYMVGLAFGRWNVRIAMNPSLAPKLPNPFAPLPVCPPGMLQNAAGLPAAPEDVPANYPLRISWPGIFTDDENHPEDIVARLEDVMRLICKDRWESIENDICEMMAVKKLRDYFRRPAGFFADHLQRYSKSRRQAPIYWPLSTAKGSYTLWLYYHRLTDQTLHTALADFVDPKLKSVRTEISALRLSGNHRTRLEELFDLEKELSDFRDEIERIIKLPWKPNLNDGVLITASPLWRLFRLPKWQKDLKVCWEKLEKGEYDWAHLAYSIWPERVEKVCKNDRSIAIAHNLEHLCQVTPPKPKRGKKGN